MKHNYTNTILSQLKSAGFTVEKNHKEQEWQLIDKHNVLMRSRYMAELARKAAKEFGI